MDADTDTNAYRPRSIRRARRDKAEIELIEKTLVEVLKSEHPTSCRRTFYQLVARGVINKTTAEYKNTVIRLLGRLRKEGRIPYYWLTDNTRWRIKPQSYGGLRDVMEETAKLYRRDLWLRQPWYVEVWCESDSVAGILQDVTTKWDVPLLVFRGYSSLTFLWNTAETIREVNKPTRIAYFGDHDPSGKDLERFAVETVREHIPDVELHFDRLAITPEQIEQYQLPGAPPKSGDTRSRSFSGETVEIEALMTDVIRDICDTYISGLVDQEALRVTRVAERSEREALSRWARLADSA